MGRGPFGTRAGGVGGSEAPAERAEGPRGATYEQFSQWDSFTVVGVFLDDSFFGSVHYFFFGGSIHFRLVFFFFVSVHFWQGAAKKPVSYCL